MGGCDVANTLAVILHNPMYDYYAQSVSEHVRI